MRKKRGDVCAGRTGYRCSLSGDPHSGARAMRAVVKRSAPNALAWGETASRRRTPPSQAPLMDTTQRSLPAQMT